MSILKRTLSLALASALMACSMTALAADDFKAPPVGRASAKSTTKTPAKAPEKQSAPNTTVLEGIDANGEKTTVTTTIEGNKKTITTTKSAGGASSSITIVTDVEQPAANGTPDGKAPVLQSISLDKKSVTAPGKIGITASVTDDISGVDWVYVMFRNINEDDKILDAGLSATFTDPVTFEQIAYADGLLHGEIEVSQYEPSGIYRIDGVNCRDVAGNAIWYYPEKPAYQPEKVRVLEKEQRISFSVKNS